MLLRFFGLSRITSIFPAFIIPASKATYIDQFLSLKAERFEIHNNVKCKIFSPSMPQFLRFKRQEKRVA